MEIKVKFNELNVKDETEKTLVRVLIAKGDKGDKPKKGIDYFTEADKMEIVNDLKETEEFKEISNSKVDKKEGYGLSQEDFTTAFKTKLEALENYDDSEIVKKIDKSLKDVTYNPSNGIFSFIANDNSSIDIDLPLELLIESGKYDKKTKKIVLTLANKDVIEIPLLDLLTDLYSKSDIDEILSNYEKKHTYFSMIIKEPVSDNMEVEIPFNYIVGNDEFEIYYNNEYLVREKNTDDEANYYEEGEIGSTSNKVKFGWDLRMDDVLVFIKKGGVALC